MEKLKEYKSIFGEAKKGVVLGSSGYNIMGFGRDTNGNGIVKLISPSGKGFSIQTNGNLPETHDMKGFKVKELDPKQLKIIEKEVLDYVKKYGSAKMK